MMRKLFITLLLVAMGIVGMAQNRIPNSNISFGFPGGGWKYLRTIDVDQNTKVYLYCFSGHTVLDAQGDTILPHMKIYVRRNYTDPLFNLVYSRYEYNPYQSLREYTDGLPSPEGIGYVAAYKNMQDNKEYMFNMIYFKDKNTAVEIRIETTVDTYEDFKDEFEAILNTVSIEK